MKYAAKCSKCEYVFQKSDTPKISNMPAICPKCQSDMEIKPLFTEDDRDYSYEIFVNCKENGGSIMGSFTLTNEELTNGKEETKRRTFQTKAIETFAELIQKDTRINNMISVNKTMR